uniref:Uncharacterized protein n=1 Tax=Fagus sylvatica TaxID=28930 RepID=A0A2N9IJ13_FAGSY
MEEQLLGCREKLKEIGSLVFDKMKMIKEMQLKCQALRLASHGYEPEKPTTEGVEQCKIEDKKTMGGSQNQTNSASHNLSKQQYSNWVEEIFARLKSLPPPQSPYFNPLRQGSDPLYMKRLEKIDYMCYNGLCP